MNRVRWTLCAATITCVAATPATRTIDFEKDNARFPVPAAWDDSVAHSGNASLRLDGDFRFTKERWVSSTKYMRLRSPITEIRFWARSDVATGFNVQLIDVAGQTHQHRMGLAADGEWHEYRITNFVGGEHWGGPKDGQVRHPLRRLVFIIEKESLQGQKRGAVWFDDIEILGAKLGKDTQQKG